MLAVQEQHLTLHKLISAIFEDDENHVSSVVLSYLFLEEVNVCNISQTKTHVHTIYKVTNLEGLQKLNQESDNIVGPLMCTQPLVGDSVQYLTTFFMTHPAITELYLDNLGVSTVDAGSLFEALSGNYVLSKLFMRKNNLGEGAGKLLGKLIGSMSNLRELHLEHNWLGKSVAHIGDALVDNKSLKTLRLSYNAIHSEGLCRLMQCLVQNKCLRKLSLDGNNIDNPGGEAIANMLRHNSNLVQLSLQNCGLESKTVGAIGGALGANQCLRDLNLGHNVLESKALAVFSSYLANANQLHSLSLANCGVKPDTLEILLRNVNPKLASLDLSSNPLGNKSMEVFEQYLPHMTGLSELELKKIGMDADGAWILEKFLTATSLKHLDLSYNFLGFALRWRLLVLENGFSLTLINCV